MKKITAMILCTLFIAVLLTSGCGKTAQKPAPDNTSESGVQQTSDSERRIMASQFSNLAMSVSGVQKATVVVSATDTQIPENVSSDPNQVPTLVASEDDRTQLTDLGAGSKTGSDISGLSSPSGEIPDVTDGRLVVMAGLDLNSASMQDINRQNSIKEEVKAKIMESDSRVSEVLVTTDPDMIKKLQDIAAGVIQGKPLQSYAQDINQLDKSIRSQ